MTLSLGIWMSVIEPGGIPQCGIGGKFSSPLSWESRHKFDPEGASI